MIHSLTRKLVLGLSGTTACIFGTLLLFAPATLHASYGITYAPDPSLMSELRAPGGALLAMGLLILSGLFRQAISGVSLVIGAAVFLPWGGARLLSIGLDGWPDGGLVWAAAIELVIGAACLAMAWRDSRDAHSNGAIPSAA